MGTAKRCDFSGAGQNVKTGYLWRGFGVPLIDFNYHYSLGRCTAVGITADGVYVLGESDIMPSGMYVWSESGGAADLATTIGVPLLHEAWITRNGSVVFSESAAGSTRHLRRWSPAQPVQDIGELPRSFTPLRWSRGGTACISENALWIQGGTVSSLPLEIAPKDITSDSGVVVGQSRDPATFDRGVIWSSQIGVRKFWRDIYLPQAYRSVLSENPYWYFSLLHDGVRGPVWFVNEDASLTASTNFGGGSVAFLWSGPLTPYCRIDCNQDGFADPDDLSDFITGYFMSPPDSISHWSGIHPPDPDDLSDFLTEYFAGCP